MNTRKGERLGWTLGWLGGFAWVAILAGVSAFQGRWLEAGLGLVLTSAAALAVLGMAPWRYPARAYWRLMLPLYGLLALSVAWAVWAYDGVEEMNGWNLLWLVPLLMPMASIGKRTWRMGEATDPAASAPARRT